MAHGDNFGASDIPGVWRAGTLTIDDLERLAGEIRPSWEVGLDVARSDAGLPADVLQSAGAGDSNFRAPAAASVAEVSALAPSPPEPPAAVSPTPAPAESPPLTARAAPAVLEQSIGAARAAPLAARASSLAVDLPLDPAPRRNNKLIAIVGGALLAVAGLALALRSGSEPAPAASLPGEMPVATQQASVATPTAPSEPAAMAPAAPVAPVAAPTAPRAVTRPSASHGSSTARARSGSSHESSRTAPSPSHRSSSSARAHRPRGVGFVTDSPY